MPNSENEEDEEEESVGSINSSDAKQNIVLSQSMTDINQPDLLDTIEPESDVKSDNIDMAHKSFSEDAQELVENPSLSSNIENSSSLISDLSGTVSKSKSIWPDSEKQKVIEGIKKYGKDWSEISKTLLNKTPTQVKNFYFNYNKKLDLDQYILSGSPSKTQKADDTQSIRKKSKKKGKKSKKW